MGVEKATCICGTEQSRDVAGPSFPCIDLFAAICGSDRYLTDLFLQYPSVLNVKRAFTHFSRGERYGALFIVLLTIVVIGVRMIGQHRIEISRTQVACDTLLPGMPLLMQPTNGGRDSTRSASMRRNTKRELLLERNPLRERIPRIDEQ